MPSLRAILFDLFGTVVEFHPKVPTIAVAGATWRSTMHWLQPKLEESLPSIPVDRVLAAMRAASEQIVVDRPPEYFEVPSRDRFRRALKSLGVDDPNLAEELSLAHMAHLASTVGLPAGHSETLRLLGTKYRLGLVSNFDHGPTARRILAAHGVADCFESIVISDGFGRRKPHPSIFLEAMRELGVAPEESLFIGDSLDDDVEGARRAGLRVVWIDAKGEGVPPQGPVADFIVRDLNELPQIVGG